MNFFKGLFRGISAWILSISLFGLAAVVGLILTIGSPQYVKATLAKSGIYKNFVASTLNLATSQTDQQKNDAINPQTVTEITPIVQASLTPEFLQQITESIVDGTYGWLDGTTKTPVISVKTADVKARLQTQMAAYINNKIATLPVCPKNVPQPEFDPLSATCKPAATPSMADINKAAADFVNSIPVLQNEELSTATIDPYNKLGTSDVGSKVPLGFSWFNRTPTVFLALIVTSGVVLVLLGKEKYRNWRTIGNTFLVAGVLLLIAGAISTVFAGNFNASSIGKASQQQIDYANTIVIPIVHILAKSLANYALYFGVGYAVIGAGCYIVAHKLKLNKLRTEQAK